MMKVKSLSTLMRKELPPIKWVVKGLIPEGFALVVGRPKLGKSFWCLQLAIAVARGNKFMGFGTSKCDVLYMAYEDGDHRMQKRVRSLIPEGPWPKGIRYSYDFVRYIRESDTHTGLATLDHYLEENSNIGLVIIDTFGKFAPRRVNRGENPYEVEYEIATDIANLAKKHRVAIVATHHHRKLGKNVDDMLEDVSGTTGLTGGADVVIGLYRKWKTWNGTMKTTGRDVDEEGYALEFKDGMWSYLGTTAEHVDQESRQAVLNYLKDEGWSTKTQMFREFAKHYFSSENSFRVILGRMETKGLIQKCRPGQGQIIYNLPGKKKPTKGKIRRKKQR